MSAHHRWYNQLSPNLKREPFDHQEDVLIIQVSYVHWSMACFVMECDASGASPGPNPMVYGLADALYISNATCLQQSVWVRRSVGCPQVNGSFFALQAHAKYGNQWALIAKLAGLEGR